MHANDDIDYERFDRLIEDQIAAGIHGLVIAGTTGQSATLEHEEQIGLIRHAHERINGRIYTIAAAGSNNTREAVHMSQRIQEEIGPTTMLHVTGYYNQPPQEGLIAHFSAVADSLRVGGSNIILYNVPGRTRSNIEGDTYVTLSQHPNIIGIKEASGEDTTEQGRFNMTRRDSMRLAILSGDDGHFVRLMMSTMGNGIISATSNVAPRYFLDMFEAVKRKDYNAAQAHQKAAQELVDLTFAATNPIPLAHMFNTHVRLPLVRLPRLERRIQETLSRYTPQQLGIDMSRYR